MIARHIFVCTVFRQCTAFLHFLTVNRCAAADAGASARAAASKCMRGVDAYSESAKGAKYAFCLPPGPQHEWDIVVEVAATIKRLVQVMMMRRERELNITATHQKLARITSARAPVPQAVPS